MAFVLAPEAVAQRTVGVTQDRGPQAVPVRGMAADASAVSDSPSTMMPDSTPSQSLSLPPDRVLLKDLEGLYEAVPFDHKSHADMAGMSSGCTLCHHHTPAGREPAACRSCHQATPIRETFRMPGLKGAYHRQCLSCHREWSHEAACNACHVSKPQRGASSELPATPTSAAAIERMSAPAKQQDTYVYQSLHSPAPVVTFHHRDHVESFGLSCVQCHRGDSCDRCHDATRTRTGRVAHTSKSCMKSSCATCHNETHCTFCHAQSERPRFNHAASAGWPLEPQHANLSCNACHGPVEDFTVPSTNCHTCHARQFKKSANQPVAAAAADGQANMNCLACHAARFARLDHAASYHPPADENAGCVTCHSLTDPIAPRPYCDRQSDRCLGCHNRPLTSSRGRSLTDIAALLTENPKQHGPIRDGNCTACHDPHASDHPHLLVKEYTPDFYTPFDLKKYALCYGCHNKNQVLNESGAAVTGFRDGDVNLHRLHVNREKGRTCRVCHEVHASRRPFHIRESVPFGDSNWTLPINFERAPSGGTCAPGCHAPRSYDRTRTLRESASAAGTNPR